MERFNSDELRAAAVALRLASRLVHVEPDESWVAQCIEDRLFDAAPFGEDDVAVLEGLRLLDEWCGSAQHDIAEETAALRREWLRLFVGVGTPEASVLESFYVEPSSIMFGRSVLDVRKAYRRWGLESQRKGSEPEDALGIMLAFCGHLAQTQADALDAGDAELAERAAAEFEGMLVEHMLPWVSAWRFLVSEHARSGYYRGVGELAFGLERACAKRLGIAFKEEDGTFAYIS